MFPLNLCTTTAYNLETTYGRNALALFRQDKLTFPINNLNNSEYTVSWRHGGILIKKKNYMKPIHYPSHVIDKNYIVSCSGQHNSTEHFGISIASFRFRSAIDHMKHLTICSQLR